MAGLLSAGFSAVADVTLPLEALIMANEQVFVPVVEELAFYEGVYIEGQTEEQSRAEVQAIHERFIEPVFGFIDSVNKSIIHAVES